MVSSDGSYGFDSALLRDNGYEDAYKLGIDWAIRQSQELLEHGVPAIHYYTMAKPDNVCQIVRAVF